MNKQQNFEYLFVEYIPLNKYEIERVNGERVRKGPSIWDYSNTLGRNGWELVAVVSHDGGRSACFFKRRIE